MNHKSLIPSKEIAGLLTKGNLDKSTIIILKAYLKELSNYNFCSYYMGTMLVQEMRKIPKKKKRKKRKFCWSNFMPFNTLKGTFFKRVKVAEERK